MTTNRPLFFSLPPPFFLLSAHAQPLWICSYIFQGYRGVGVYSRRRKEGALWSGKEGGGGLEAPTECQKGANQTKC